MDDDGPCAIIEVEGPWAETCLAVPMKNTPANETIIATASSAGMMLVILSLNERFEMLKTTGNISYWFPIGAGVFESTKTITISDNDDCAHHEISQTIGKEKLDGGNIR